MSNNTNFSLIIPTYNERVNIEYFINTCEEVLNQLSINYEIIVVDDNSPDGTSEVVKKLSNDKKYLKLLTRNENKGLSPSVIDGFKIAKGDVLGVIDADFQHPPKLLGKMLSKINKNDSDIVIASRYTDGSKIENWNILRRISSLTASSFSKLLLNKKLKGVTDPMSGCFLVKSSVYNSENLNPKGFKILLELLSKLKINKIDEVPYSFNLRKHGDSKFGLREIFIYLMQVVKLSIYTKEFLNLKVLLISIIILIILIRIFS